MSKLKDKLAEIIPVYRDRIAKLRKEHASVELGVSTVGTSFGGLRGVNESDGQHGREKT